MYVMCVLTTICIYIFWFVCVCTQHMYMFAVAALRANSRFFGPYLVAPHSHFYRPTNRFQTTNCFQKNQLFSKKPTVFKKTLTNT